MEKTAVEWLTEKMQLILGDEFKYVIGFFEQTKEMEKQQIKNAFEKGFITTQWDKTNENKAEQYYNETFKQQ